MVALPFWRARFQGGLSGYFPRRKVRSIVPYFASTSITVADFRLDVLGSMGAVHLCDDLGQASRLGATRSTVSAECVFCRECGHRDNRARNLHIKSKFFSTTAPSEKHPASVVALVAIVASAAPMARTFLPVARA